MSAGAQIDYEALAKQAGAISSQPSAPASGSIDYAALAKQAGSTNYQPPSQNAPAKAADPMADEFIKSFGFKDGSQTNLSDVPGELWSNLKNAVKQSFTESQKVTGEADKPVYGSPFSMALTVPNLIVNSAEGMASGLESGSSMAANGVRQNDPDQFNRGVGRILASAAQIALAKEGSGEGGSATDYSPRSVQDIESGQGTVRPANALQGSINRSMGTMVRDVRYGDPSQALVDEGIISPTASGRLAAVTSKLNELKPQLDQALASNPGQVDIVAKLDPIVSAATKQIKESFETDATKQAALQDIDSLWSNALAKAPSGVTDLATANEIKQGIGDAINFEKRPSPMMPATEHAFRQAYGAIKQDIGDQAPDVADLNGRVSNLLAARGALRDLLTAQKAGRGPLAGLSLGQKAEAAVGAVAPAAIRSAQVAAGVPVRQAVGIGSGAISQQMLGDLLGGNQ